MITLSATAPESLSRSTESTRPPVRVGLVQHRWRSDADELAKVLRDDHDEDGDDVGQRTEAGLLRLQRAAQGAERCRTSSTPCAAPLRIISALVR